MQYIPQTPFRRAASAALPAGHAPAPDALRPPRDTGDSADKWQVLRDLGAVRQNFGLSDRDVAVLAALVSFHPAKVLMLGGDLVIHPANATICARLNGMACSTMRRHLARLVDSGLILRRDSPNGKRYARRSAAGKVAFGFDLSPLIYIAVQLAEMAEDARAEAEALRDLRERVSLMRRDLRACAQSDDVTPALRDRLLALSDDCARALRRKTAYAALQDWDTALRQAFADLQNDMLHATELSTNCAQNEQHHKTPDSEIFSSGLVEVTGAGHTDAQTFSKYEDDSFAENVVAPFHACEQFDKIRVMPRATQIEVEVEVEVSDRENAISASGCGKVLNAVFDQRSSALGSHAHVDLVMRSASDEGKPCSGIAEIGTETGYRPSVRPLVCKTPPHRRRSIAPLQTGKVSFPSLWSDTCPLSCNVIHTPDWHGGNHISAPPYARTNPPKGLTLITCAKPDPAILKFTAVNSLIPTLP